MLAVLHSTFVPQDKSIGSSLNKCITHSRRKCKHFSSNTTFKNSTIYTKYVCFSCSVVSDSCDPTDCSPLGSSVHGILQTRILECAAIPSPGDLPNPGIKPGSPALQADYLLTELRGKHWVSQVPKWRWNTKMKKKQLYLKSGWSEGKIRCP